MSSAGEKSSPRAGSVEWEVPGTPEAVWDAIATGPGISSWFVPTEVEERVGGAVAFHLGGGIESTGVVTGWEPPHRFAYEEPAWNPPAPALGTEFLVEALSGGTCRVRVVHSLFTSSEEWDNQLEGMETGWKLFFGVLGAYLEHYRGQRAASIRLLRCVPGSETDFWKALTGALAPVDAAGNTMKIVAPGLRPFTGTVERTAERPDGHDLLLVLHDPTPGLALFATHALGGDQVYVSVSFYLFGDDASAVAASAEPLWQAWMDAQIGPEAGT